MRGRKRGAVERHCLWCHAAIAREQPDIYIPLLQRFPEEHEAVFADVPRGDHYEWLGPHCGWHCAWFNAHYELCGEAWEHFRMFYAERSPIPPPQSRQDVQEAVEYNAKRK